jgi:hypothetical protein
VEVSIQAVSPLFGTGADAAQARAGASAASTAISGAGRNAVLAAMGMWWFLSLYMRAKQPAARAASGA